MTDRPRPEVDGDFTLAGYRALVESLLEEGYQLGGISGGPPTGKYLLLRHDIDMSVDSALRIAEVENSMGVASTYFVLVQTEMYNPFSGRSQAAIRRLHELGHDVGLHFDAEGYGRDLDVLDDAIDRECDVLEAITGSPVSIVSFHRPAEGLLGLDRLVGGRRHTYEPSLFSSIGYCSDSAGTWRHGHPLDHPAVREGLTLQLLTHPIWWDASAGETVRAKLDRFALGRFDLLRAELARNCSTYPQEFGSLDPE